MSDPAREQALAAELRGEYERRSREFLELPADTTRLVRAVVGVPTRLLREDGTPSFNLSFYAVDRQGRYAGVAMWGADREYAVCTESGPELVKFDTLYPDPPAA